MKLNVIRISGFRSFANATRIVLSPQMTALIGENDGGKTACLDAIRLLLGTYNPTEDDYTKLAGQPVDTIIIDGWFEVSSDEERQLLRDFSAPIMEDLHVIASASPLGRVDYAVDREIPADPDLNVDLPNLTIPDLKSFAEQNSIDVSHCQRKEQYVDILARWLQSQPHSVGPGPLPKQIRAQFPSLVTFDSADAIDPEQTISKVLRQYAEDEMKKEKYAASIKHIESGIRAELYRQSRSLEKFIKKYNPDIESARVEPQFREGSWLTGVSLNLAESGHQSIPLNSRGEGKRRKVTLGVHEWNSQLLAAQAVARHDLIYTLDEPDTHLDYGAQRQLYGILRQYCHTGIQMVICTHSLNLINRMSLDELVYFQLDDQLHTIARKFASNDDPDAEWAFVNQIGSSMGLDNATMFHERCFLIVEGPTEMNALPSLFRVCYGDAMQSYGVKLVNGESSGAARCLAKYLNANGKRVTFLLDQDCCQPQSNSRNSFTYDNLSRDGFDVAAQVVFVGTKEFEDSFSDSVLRRVATTLKPEQSSGTASRKIRDLRERLASDPNFKFSEKFAGDVCGTSKPEMGKVLGKTVKRKADVPDSIRHVFDNAVRMANDHQEESMLNVLDQFKSAIDRLLLVEVSFFSRDDNKVIKRKCVPLDYGPSRRAASTASRYHFIDLESDSLPRYHVLSLLPEQVSSLKLLDENFKPADYITWDLKKSPWFLHRDWGKFS